MRLLFLPHGEPDQSFSPPQVDSGLHPVPIGTEWPKVSHSQENKLSSSLVEGVSQHQTDKKSWSNFQASDN